MQESVFRYFPQLKDVQKEQISRLRKIYEHWNNMINVISRKDMDNFYIHHVLHSMAISKVITFLPGTKILDVGTGGGFPGVPLAIMFPESQFTLLDSIQKKIKVVASVAEELGLNNVNPVCQRAEENREKYDFVISRAVTEFTAFVNLTKKNIDKSGINSLRNGILYLKGGDLSEELAPFLRSVTMWNINVFFDEPFFETKRIVYLPV